jgi:outer membrane protein OmpA-like peptidoglycan-associated protein
MSRTKRLFEWVILSILSIITLISCTQEIVKPYEIPVKFHDAIPILTNNLLMQVNKKQGLLGNLRGQKKIVLEPFIVINSGDVVQVSRDIETAIFAKTRKTFGDKFAIYRMTQKSVGDADYSMYGVIHYDTYKGASSMSGKKYYRVVSLVLDRKTGTVVARSAIWISDKKLDYTPIVDSPMIIQDQRTEKFVRMMDAPVGQKVKQPDDSFNALMTEAETAYEKQDYKLALSLFTKASKHKDGKRMMKTHARLYMTYIKLERWDDAEKTFGKLVSLGVEKRNLSVKFLFLVNSTGLYKGMRNQYDIWLRQIGKYFNNSGGCLNIVGHSSHTGTLEYNDKLSLRRAKSIQQLLQNNFHDVMQNSKAIGKGFRENIVGSGTDDVQDAIDRRVEFKVVECSEI